MNDYLDELIEESKKQPGFAASWKEAELRVAELSRPHSAADIEPHPITLNLIPKSSG